MPWWKAIGGGKEWISWHGQEYFGSLQSAIYEQTELNRTERSLLISPPRDCKGGPWWSPQIPMSPLPTSCFILHRGTAFAHSTSILSGALGLSLQTLIFIYLAENSLLWTYMLVVIQIPQKTKIILPGMSARKTKCRQAMAGEDKQ